MHRPFRLILLALLLATVVWGKAGTELRFAADWRAARQVHALLAPDRWAQVIRISNDEPTRTMPAVTWATVFELRDRLWIYLPREGTSSLSVYRDRMAADKLDLSLVLAHRHRGWQGYEVVRADARSGEWDTVMPEAADIPNGCFVRSLAWFQGLASVVDAHLLMIYGGSGPTRWGHTVLCYATPAGWYYWDPDAPAEARIIPGGNPGNDLARARRVSPGVQRSRIEQARRFDLMATG